MIVGHSIGASMILKYPIECAVQKKIKGISPIATPFGVVKKMKKYHFFIFNKTMKN
jgi:predicted alpha/beta hydrolase family esterase